MNRPAYPKYKPSGVAWLGEVPEHWEVLPLKRFACLRSGESITAEQIEEDGEYPVYGGNGLRGYTDRYTHEGHFALVGRQGALCGNVNYAQGKFWASEHAVVATPVRPLATFWLGELMRAMNLNQYSVSAAQPGISVDAIANLRIPAPPLPEQRAIADFLDRETSRIDTLVAKKRELIARLKERRAALITRAVTRGLDPAAKLKESGVEWLGMVPEEWEVRPLGYLVKMIGGGTPDKGNADFWDGEIPWVSPKDMKTPQLFDSEDHITAEALQQSPVVIVPINSLLIVVRGMILAHSFPVALSKVPLTINQDMKALVCRHTLLPGFLFYTTTGFASAFVSLAGESAHGTRKLETGIIQRFSVPLPPLEDQTALVEHLDRETGKLDRLTATVEAAIERLSEYRAALITAAVTGKIDVREAPAKEAA